MVLKQSTYRLLKKEKKISYQIGNAETMGALTEDGTNLWMGMIAEHR